MRLPFFLNHRHFSHYRFFNDFTLVGQGHRNMAVLWDFQSWANRPFSSWSRSRSVAFDLCPPPSERNISALPPPPPSSPLLPPTPLKYRRLLCSCRKVSGLPGLDSYSRGCCDDRSTYRPSRLGPRSASALSSLIVGTILGAALPHIVSHFDTLCSANSHWEGSLPVLLCTTGMNWIGSWNQSWELPPERGERTFSWNLENIL